MRLQKLFGVLGGLLIGLIGMGFVGQPALGASQDGTVQWAELEHDSRSTLYRSPAGPVPTGTSVRLRLRAAHNDLTGVQVRVWNDRADQEAIYTLSVAAENVTLDGSGTAYDLWEVSLPASSQPTVYWYRFIVTDGGDTDYYEDDANRTGGVGQAYDTSLDRSWQLTIFDDQFRTPDWVKNAVVYQIFPDRFRDGDTGNNPGAGEFFYGTFDTIVRSNDGAGAWNAHICDPRSRPGSGSTCSGAYSQNFYGGDLQGIIDKMDYLETLGVTALYLNPIFESPSNHKYDTTNFFKVDDNFGDLSTLQLLLAEANARGIRVILDGVFNHTSSDSYYFDRYDRWNGTAPGPSDPAGSPVVVGTSSDSGACETTDDAVSPYVDWYSFYNYTGSGSAPCSDNRDYPKWFGIFDSLPVLQHDNPEVRDYFISQGTNSVGPYWIGQGVDGWRLDVAPEIDHGTTVDPSDDYWENFRAAVRAENPDTYIVGEEWGNATPWTIGEEWDATMNYPFASTVLSFWRDQTYTDNDFNAGSSAGELAPLSPSQVNERLLNLEERYAPEAFQAMMNLFNSHDTNRALFLLDPNAPTSTTSTYNDPNYDWSPAIQRLKGATIMQMTLPGAPTIYYGDEVGTVNPPAYDGSQWQDDPYNRAPYPWTDESGTPYYSHMPDAGLRAHYETLIDIRTQAQSLRTGTFDPVLTDDAAEVYAYGRKMEDDTDVSVVAVNSSTSAKNVTLDLAGYLPAGMTLTDAFNGGTVTPDASGQLAVTVPAQSGVILRGSDFSGQRPACVTDLSATASGTDVALSWSAVANADTYRVLRSRVAGGGYETITTVSGTSTTDTSAPEGTRHVYTVEAVNSTTRLTRGRCGNESSATPALTIDWANLQFPPIISHVISAVDSTDTIYGQLYIAGATDSQSQPVEGITAQVGYGPAGTAPSSSEWRWFDMRPNPGYDFTLNNDEHLGKMLPRRTGTFKFTTRWSTDGGQSWTYTDQIGPPYDEVDAGDLTITRANDTTPPTEPTDFAVESAASNRVTLTWTPIPNVDGDAVGYFVKRKRTSASTYTDSVRVDGASTDRYTDDTVVAGETYEYQLTAFDANFNTSTEAGPVTATAETQSVDVTFRATVPADTPNRYPVHVTGTVQETDWVPDDTQWQMTQVNGTTWELTKALPAGVQYEYKYVRSADARVEKAADGNTDIANRTFTVTESSTTQLLDDTVENWRDPYVVDATPVDGATGLTGSEVEVVLAWNQSMPSVPSGFTLSGPNGAVSGTWSYDSGTFTHTFTPDAALDVGTYTAAVSGAQDTAGDVQQVDVDVTFAVGAIPVELAALDARRDDGRVVVEWTTASETNNAGFAVERAADDGAFEKVGFVNGSGTRDVPTTYRYRDGDVPFTAETLTYRLRQIDQDGSEAVSDPVTVRRGAPDELALAGIFPQPARGQVTVRYALPEDGAVTLRVYDLLGRAVATWTQGRERAGRKEITADLSSLASGTYFVRLRAGDDLRTERLVVVK